MKRICIIGGGHGTSRLIKGFKDKDVNIDIIVASSDNGGHTGEIIKEFDVPALGDLRMVLESVVEKPLVDFLSYRFDSLHGKNRVSLGNLMLLSIVLETGSVNEMLNKINGLIDSKYHFYLANNEYVELKALDKNDNVILGEENIGNCDCIKDIFLERQGIVEDSVIDAINSADIIIFSFGSFYTSLGSVIISSRIKQALKEAKGEIVYVPNLVNQTETKDYSLDNYVNFIENKIERKIDRVLISNSKIKRKIIKRYALEGKSIVAVKQKKDNYRYYDLISRDNDKLRHDVDYLAKIILDE